MSNWVVYGYKTLRNGLSRRSAMFCRSKVPAQHSCDRFSYLAHSMVPTECAKHKNLCCACDAGTLLLQRCRRREMSRHRGDGAWMEAVPLSRTADDQTLQDWSVPLLPRLLVPHQPTCRPTVHHALPSTRDDEVVARCEMAGSCVSLVEHKQADASVQCTWTVVDRQEQRNHHSLPIQCTRPSCTVLTAVVRGQARATWAAVYEHEAVTTSDR